MIIIIIFIIFILLIILSCLRKTELFATSTSSTTNVNIPLDNRNNYIINNEFKIDKNNSIDIKKINASKLCIRDSNTDNIECLTREELYNFLKLNTFRKNSVCIDDACIDKNSVKLLNGSKPIRFKNLSEESSFKEKCIGYDVFDAHTCKNKVKKSCKNIVNTNPWIKIGSIEGHYENYSIPVGPSETSYSKEIVISGNMYSKLYTDETHTISTKKEIVNDIEETIIIAFHCDSVEYHSRNKTTRSAVQCSLIPKKKFKFEVSNNDKDNNTTKIIVTRIDEFKSWTENLHIMIEKKQLVKCFGDLRFRSHNRIGNDRDGPWLTYDYNKIGNEKSSEFHLNGYTFGYHQHCEHWHRRTKRGKYRCRRFNLIQGADAECREPILEDDGTKTSSNLDDYKFPIQSLVPETCGKDNSSNFTLSPGLMVSGIDPNFTASNEENNYYNSNLFTDHH
jgi:hypothetical protein